MHFDDAPMLSGRGSLFGHLPEFRKSPLTILQRVCAERADIVRIGGLPDGVIGAIGEITLAHDVLVTKAKSFEKSPVLRTALAPVAGRGLFTSEGEPWRRQRKLMAPMFVQRELDRYADAMRSCTERAMNDWRDVEELDVARETTRITMAVAGSTLFDADTFADADDIGASITTVLGWIEGAAFSPWMLLQVGLRKALLHRKEALPPLLRGRADRWLDALLRPIPLPDRRSRRMRAAVRSLDARVARMIAERRARTSPRHDLLTRLLQAHDEDGAPMSDRQIRDEVLTLFIAGHETTATGLAWSLYLLARHDDVRQRVYAEVDALGDRPIGAADLPRLTLTSQIFKESLRIYPPLYMLVRQAMEDVTIGRWLVPKGTVLLVSPYVIHRHPEMWPNPERFDPSRFTAAAEQARPRSAYLPFGAGPRTCIGNHFAYMEATIVLATLLQRARFEANAAVEPEPSATLRPRGGMPMRVSLRGRNTVPSIVTPLG